MAARRLPLTVIGGFLGAGKTTLLNHWLRHADGQRLAVLVNDFGALNIDAGLIASSAGDTFALTNGCVCCQIGDDLSRTLMQVLDQADQFDGVVIEASGVSDPWRIAQMGRADPGLFLDGIVVLVDASVALAQSRDPLLTETVERQVKAAGLIVVNKCDLASSAELAALRDWVARVAGPVAIVETTRAVLPMPLLTGLAMPPARCGDDDGSAAPCASHPHDHAHAHAAIGGGHGEPHHGEVFMTWQSQTQRIFERDDLREWLRTMPAGVLRLKGVLRTGGTDASGWSEIQFAGRHGTVRAAAAPSDGPAVVAIGLLGALPVQALSDWVERTPMRQ